MPRGYDRPLYILPFDHRGSFQTKMFGWKAPLSDDADRGNRRRQAGHLRRLPSGARRTACPRRRPASWSTSNSAPPSCAMRPPRGVVTACPAEKSGQDEFDFEYGEDFARHIEAFHPTFCKVLVRYNPEGDRRVERAAGRAIEAPVRLPRRREPQPLHVRAAGAGREGAARQAQGRQEGLRSRAAAPA